jgi:hypothetical protein
MPMPVSAPAPSVVDCLDIWMSGFGDELPMIDDDLTHAMTMNGCGSLCGNFNNNNTHNTHNSNNSSKYDADCISFDMITSVLSRCGTPPPESLPSSPLQSSQTSPTESCCPSPIPFPAFMFEYECETSTGAASLASTPYSSSPASPCSPSDAFSPSSSSSSSFNSSSKLQGRRLSKQSNDSNDSSSSSSSKAMKVKKIAKAEMAAAKPNKRSKAVALASKRDSHNISERNRRQELKLSFNLLQNLVPNLVSANRAHTGTVLKETIAYIVALQQEEEELLAAKNALLVEQSALIMSA